MKLQVECYAGHADDQRPIKFWVGDAALFVESIEEQWNGPDAFYFRLRADDGNTYLIGRHATTDEWTLESVRSQATE